MPLWTLLADLRIQLPNPGRIQPEKSLEKLSPRQRMKARQAEIHPETPMDIMAALEQLLSEGELQPYRPKSSSRAQCWVAADKTVTIADYDIPGMVYVGESLASVKSYNFIEPSLIIPSLKVKSDRPDYAGQHVDYYPTYGRIPPTSRAAYLEWLSDGRRTPDVHVAYLWLFFYGLERRVFYDLLGAGRQPNSSMQELEVILEEVVQLRAVYRDSEMYSTFTHKADLFIDLCSVIYSKEALYETLNPFEANLILLQIGLGQMVAQRHPIPANWALAWYVRLSKNRLRSAATRCMEELQALFALRYTENYGEGMKLKPGKSVLSIDYYPASQTFNRFVQVDVGNLPDVSKFTSKINQLDRLVMDSTTQLEPLGRLLGRNPNARNTSAAIALLPPELLATHGGETVQNLKNWLASQFSQSLNAIAVSGKELFQYWSGANSEKLSKSEAEGLSQMLERLGYGIEPDVRLGGAVPKLASWVGIFRLNTDNLSYLSPEYLTATLTVHLAIAVASGDELPNSVEQDYLRTHLESLIPLTRGERSRFQAHLQLLLQEKPNLRGLKTRVEAVLPETRGAIARFLVSVAVADGQASPKEIDRLTKVYTLLELDPQILYSNVHDISANSVNSRPATEPITIRAAFPTKGHQIPAPPQQNPLVLDMSIVESKISESQEVSSLLADIFVEELPAPQTTPITGIAGLDAAHSQLLQALAQKPEWQRAELEAIALALNLMLDGALEVINEAAFDQYDESVIEGDHPFEVNADVLQELLA
ncbi:MAG: TerB N-terminal domain-containing protein [Timaviella obliquedivisa GSE-PSE-MK23-08B]|nr:TerB N-terminal domain-containing protein [Timaviella obliquedivisa GSE-PSE-MK23-08B]